MTTKRQLRAEVATLRDSSARMQRQLANALNQRDMYRAEATWALDELEHAVDELRRVRGDLARGAADRAMPEPPEVEYREGAA